MRDPWISEPDALRERMSNPVQVTADEPQAALPPYATSFLAHLRLLTGVPFQYLIPDAAMLPEESIRFFHVDRSWTDRLVDGVLTVGEVGSREQAHHHAAGPALAALLDSLEPTVRPAQRGLPPVQPAAPADPAITGFLLRSALVSGWPQMEVRAFRNSVKLTLLRLERLSAGVLIALFAGVPDRVELEEPHHGMQLGVLDDGTGMLTVDARRPDGTASGTSFQVAVRATDPGLRVLEIAALRQEIIARADPALPPQTGSAELAIELMRPPWKEIFADQAATPAVAEPARARVLIGEPS
ncbi:MAG TPA: hypothetical protein VFB06_00710 [Streptosporangiaceae bacterium]|nr:hypothetical protein [Streptosporangiaceae bacterium]